jgi:hypothetical protein
MLKSAKAKWKYEVNVQCSMGIRPLDPTIIIRDRSSSLVSAVVSGAGLIIGVGGILLLG